MHCIVALGDKAQLALRKAGIEPSLYGLHPFFQRLNTLHEVNAATPEAAREARLEAEVLIAIACGVCGHARCCRRARPSGGCRRRARRRLDRHPGAGAGRPRPLPQILRLPVGSGAGLAETSALTGSGAQLWTLNRIAALAEQLAISAAAHMPGTAHQALRLRAQARCVASPSQLGRLPAQQRLRNVTLVGAGS